MNREQLKAGLDTLMAVADAIWELGQVPSGLLYSMLMDKLDLAAYERLVDILGGAGVVRKGPMHTLHWTGPAKPTAPAAHPGDWTTTNRNGLYNCDASLFRNARRSYTERGIKLVVTEDGAVKADKDGYVARCESGAAAMAMLVEAGYIFKDGTWTPKLEAQEVVC